MSTEVRRHSKRIFTMLSIILLSLTRGWVKMPGKSDGFDGYPEAVAKNVNIPDGSLPRLLDETDAKYLNHISISF